MAAMTPIFDVFNFCCLQDRLESFKKWPFSSKHACSAEKMAEAGFYQPNPLEEPDLAKCFICQKELDGWEENDDPMQEHQRHQNSCAFVALGKKEVDLTLEELLVIMEKSVLQSAEKIKTQREESLKEDYQKYIKTFEKRWKKKN